MVNKKVAFIVERNLYYKYYSPIIQNLLKLDIEIHLFHYNNVDSISSENHKMLYYANMNQVPQFCKSVKFIYSANSFVQMFSKINQMEFDFIVSLHPRSYYSPLSTKAKWITVQHGYDSTKYSEMTSDFYLVYTKDWFKSDLLIQTHPIEVGLYHTQASSVKSEIFDRYMLSPEKKYVLFIPLPSSDYKSYFFLPFGKLNYFALKLLTYYEKKLLQKLCKELKKRNTNLLIKSRYKKLLPAEYSQFGKILYDELYYPNTTQDLVQICDHVFINFMPGAITTEIAALNKSYTYINYPVFEKAIHTYTKDFMNDLFLPASKENSWVNYTDIQKIVNYEMRYNNIPQSYVDKYISPKEKMNLTNALKMIMES